MFVENNTVLVASFASTEVSCFVNKFLIQMYLRTTIVRIIVLVIVLYEANKKNLFLIITCVAVHTRLSPGYVLFVSSSTT